uniref:Uncharacterized protein n=1 Tax=Rhizophora mucronata TaxID=61149 RepID=A0A2P2MTC3_RHIMU
MVRRNFFFFSCFSNFYAQNCLRWVRVFVLFLALIGSKFPFGFQ